MILSYPVITAGKYRHSGSAENITNNDEAMMKKVSLENHITPDYPPAFIWHTFAVVDGSNNKFFLGYSTQITALGISPIFVTPKW